MNGPRVPDAINLQEEWRLGNQLGAGGFADVYRARSGNGTPAVVKLVRKLPGTHRELLFTELVIIARRTDPLAARSGVTQVRTTWVT